MKRQVSFEIVHLNDITPKVITDIKNNRNIYACGIDTVNKLISAEMPIQNRNIAIRNILSFLRYIDNRLKTQTKTCLDISSATLIAYFSRDHYKKYLSLLKELKVISDVPYKDGSFYTVKEKFKLYQVFARYLKQDICLVIFNKDKGEIEYKIEGSYNSKFVKTIKKVNIDISAAIEDEIKNRDNTKVNSLRCRLNRIFSLYDRRFIRKGRKVDRVYTSLSNLSKISRKHLTIAGLQFYNMDIKNCQPLLLCYLLIRENMPIDQEYINVCQQGIFYDGFYEQSGNVAINEQRRRDTKVSLYKSIFFGFKRTKTNLRFKELYPLTYSSLEILAQGQDKLAGLLQNIEASIFNYLVPVKSKYYYTLFDAIYFTSVEDKADLFLRIHESFRVYGLMPSIEFDSKECEMDEEELREYSEF